MTTESQLKPEHDRIVNRLVDGAKHNLARSYMLTTSRDGESPARTINRRGFYANNKY